MTHDFLVIDEGPLTIETLGAFAGAGGRVEVAPRLIERMDSACAAAAARACQAPLYGVTTGLGPMVRVAISPPDAAELQYNLVRSHAAGLGPALPERLSRAVLLARLQSITRNRSATSGAVAAQMAALLCAGIAPVIPRKGGVGASGDLVQLAHMALGLIGEGEVWRHGQRMPAAEAFSAAGLASLRLSFRDGLALMNGTSAMAALAAMAVLGMRRLLDETTAMTALLAELVRMDGAAYSAALNSAKGHPTQSEVAARLRARLEGSARLSGADERGARPLQEHYSIRCAPQVLGPMLANIEMAGRTVEEELNAASDNPCFDPDTGEALHGGNFHGEYVAVAMDVLKISAVKASVMLERQLNFLLNDDINRMLPAFVNLGRPGIELGLQGAQFTATSTAAENQTLAFPMSVHSISSNKDNQDVVSMGFNAAWLTLQVLDNAFDVAAVQALALSQAGAALGAWDDLSPAGRALLTRFRAAAPVFEADVPLSAPLAALTDELRGGEAYCS